MPFSRSRSPESIARSSTCWCSPNAPDCQSILSTSVVLPWSTWATMATLRMSARVVTLLMQSTTGILASALRSTNRVWGSGPSEASTSRTTPSTMDRPRSTSPPKSAWPGVSMMLIVDAVGQARLGGRLAGVVDRGVLREDRDALLALQVTRVHRPFVDVLVLAERTGLPEHLVDQRGLSVVNVGNDGDIADVTAGLHGHEHHCLRLLSTR